MKGEGRKFSLGIWVLGFGYFVFYTPYSALTKAVSNGLLSSDRRSVPGPELLPASVFATVITMFLIISAAGWWKYAGRRRFFGVSIPFPSRLTFLSGLCIATIIGTTTLAFSFEGISIVLVLVLLRGGTLIIGPIVDYSLKRRVRWFSWAAMTISLLALIVALADVSNYRLTTLSVFVILAYLTGYFFRFRIMTRIAKSDDRNITMRYFVEEQIVATPVLLLVLGVLAMIGSGEILTGFRRGFTLMLASDAVVPVLFVGVFYAALCVCTTLIFLDRRENTFCIPMHCGSSMLSGIVASWLLTLIYGQAPPSSAQLAGAGLIVIALGLLSPLHHIRVWRRLTDALASSQLLSQLSMGSFEGGGRPTRATAGNQSSIDRLFLFVCSGNTCRSAMAEVIGRSEAAKRLNLSAELKREPTIKMLSAGVSAKPGAPMTAEAQTALRRLGFTVPDHVTRRLTAQMVEEAEVIYCMADSHRRAIIEMYPFSEAKTKCLDPTGDVDDPVGSGLDTFVSCARQIQQAISLRFNELGFEAQY